MLQETITRINHTSKSLVCKRHFKRTRTRRATNSSFVLQSIPTESNLVGLGPETVMAKINFRLQLLLYLGSDQSESRWSSLMSVESLSLWFMNMIVKEAVGVGRLRSRAAPHSAGVSYTVLPAVQRLARLLTRLSLFTPWISPSERVPRGHRPIKARPITHNPNRTSMWIVKVFLRR